MTKFNPAREDFLAIVSEWSSYGKQSGSRVGNAYPIYNFTTGQVVDDPMEAFPNPGAVFLLNRNAETWDYVRVQPLQNSKYTNTTDRECYFFCHQVTKLDESFYPDPEIAVLLDVPSFDLRNPVNAIRSPAQNVTPLFFVRNAQQHIFGPLRCTRANRKGLETVDSLQYAPWNHHSLI